ncbi:MAG: ankyrin repeat domain-containing protein [Tatlockia sp.]|nr:ankyrin repeat domain-containing protein [Tatlockia sp.]
MLVKDWIYTKFQLDTPENEQQLQSFAEANKTYGLFKNFISVLPTWNHEQIKPEDIYLLQSLLDSYFSDCITEGAPCIASKLLLTQMELFQSACLIYARDVRMDWIENFFALWSIPTDEFKQHKLLYKQLLAPLKKEKILLSDSFIQTQFQYNCEVYLTPYIINRVFLHAILVPPLLWTTSFAKIMSEVFNFVSKGFENHENLYQSEKLKMDSYSRPLLKQLNYLINYHAYLQGDKSAVEPKAVTMFVPMPHLVKKLGTLAWVLILLPKSQRQTFLMDLDAEVLKKIISKWSELKVVLKILAESDRMTLVNIIGAETLITLLKDGYDLESLLKKLPELERIILINKIGGETLGPIIFDIDELKSVLKRLPESDRITLIESLGPEVLKKIIEDKDELKSILKKLPEKDRMTLINIVGVDALKTYIKQGFDLGVILGKLAEKDRITLIKFLGLEFLKTIITDTAKLNSLLNDFAELDRINLLHTIGSEPLQTLIKDRKELKSLLNELAECDRISLINTLGLESLKTLIKNGSGLSSILKKLPDPMLLINNIGIEALKLLIEDGYQLASIVNRLPELNRLPFIDDLGLEFIKRLITNEGTLTSLLRDLAEFDRITLLKSFGSEALKKIINNEEELESVLSELLEFDRIILINTLGYEALKTLITDAIELKSILKKLPESDRLLLIDNIGTEALKLIIKNSSQLTKILKQLPESDRITLINYMHGINSINRLITDVDELMKLFELCPPKDWTIIANLLEIEALEEDIIEELLDKIIFIKKQDSDICETNLGIKIYAQGKEISYKGCLTSYVMVNKLLQLVLEHCLGSDQNSNRLIISLALNNMNWESNKKELFLLKLIGFINPNRDFLTAISLGILTVKLMISRGYTPTKEICEAAILSGDHQIINFLLEQKNADFEGARVNLIKSGYTPLMFYAAINNRRKVEHLIAFSEDEDIEKTLINSAKLGRSEIVKILIAARVTKKQKNINLVAITSEFSQQNASNSEPEIYTTFIRNSQANLPANIRQTSCFSARQIRDINSKINELENEIDNSCLGFFESRKNQKIAGLKQLLKIAEKPGISIEEAINQVEKDERFPEIRSGVFSTRTAKLLDSLLEIQNLSSMQAN